MGVPALLPQRRELGWPNRGAATTPGADVGGAPIMGGRGLIAEGSTRSTTDLASVRSRRKQPDPPRVGLLTQIPIPVALEREGPVC